MNRLIALASHLLDPADRESVLGDFAESSVTGGAALRGIAGLVLRRQASLWLDWRPWLAFIGIASITAFSLSDIAFHLDANVSLQLGTYLRHGVHYGTGVTVSQDLIHLVCVLVSLLLWSWSAGFLLAALSGRCLWLTGLVFYLVVHNAARDRFLVTGNIVLRQPSPWALFVSHVLPFDPATCAFLLAASAGAAYALRRRCLSFRLALLLFAAVAILTALVLWTSQWYQIALQTMFHGAWPATPWYTGLPLFSFASWPAAFLLVFTARTKFFPTHGPTH